MARQLVLEVRYSEGNTERHYPAVSRKEGLDNQADRLREFLLAAIGRGGAFSVELDRDEGGPSRRIFRVEQIAAADVFLMDEPDLRRREKAVPDPRKSFFFLQEIAQVNPVYQV